MTDPVRPAAVKAGLDLALEIREALDDPKRGEWGGYPWEHLGDAERDVRVLVAALDGLAADLEQATHDTKEQRAIAGNWRQLYEREQKRLETAREALRPFAEIEVRLDDTVSVHRWIRIRNIETARQALAAGSVAPPDGEEAV